MWPQDYALCVLDTVFLCANVSRRCSHTRGRLTIFRAYGPVISFSQKRLYRSSIANASVAFFAWRCIIWLIRWRLLSAPVFQLYFHPRTLSISCPHENAKEPIEMFLEVAPGLCGYTCFPLCPEFPFDIIFIRKRLAEVNRIENHHS